MPATVSLVDEVAMAALPLVSLVDQIAQGSVSHATVSIVDEHADFGGGSQARVFLLGQHANTAPTTSYEPAFFGKASGSQSWALYQFHVSNGSGEWLS